MLLRAYTHSIVGDREIWPILLRAINRIYYSNYPESSKAPLDFADGTYARSTDATPEDALHERISFTHTYKLSEFFVRALDRRRHDPPDTI
jgi:hypothetical protein